MLTRILVTDDPNAAGEDAQLIVWVGSSPAPAVLQGPFLIERRSFRSAATFLTRRPAELRLRLHDPIAFVHELDEVRALPVLRVA